MLADLVTRAQAASWRCTPNQGVTTLLLLTACAACDDPAGINRRPAEILWEVSLADGPRTRPLLTDSLAIFGTFDGRTVAFHRSTGTTVWSRKLSDFVWGREITTAAGHVLVAEYELWALDPRTGAVRWRYAGPDGAAGVDEPAIAGDTLYLGSAFGWAIALDAQTGQALWTVDLGERPFRPTIAGDLVIFGTRSFQGQNPNNPEGRDGPLGEGHLIALRRADGSEAWRFAISDSAGFPLSGGALNGGVVWQDRVIVGSRSSRMHALRLTDGTLLWERSFGSPPAAPYTHRPALVRDVVVIVRGDGLVEAWEPQSGERVWTRTGATSGAGADVVAAGSKAYVAASWLTLFAEDGTIVWQWGGDSPSFAGAPSVGQDGRLFLWGTRRERPSESIAFALVPPVQP